MTATLRNALLAAFLSLASASGAVAAAAAPPEVTITAPRPPTAEELAGEAVPNFVKSHSTPSTVIGQLTRWRDGICPLTRGLDDAMTAFVTARIRAVAAAVGAPLDESSSCKANVTILTSNVTILFTLEPQKVVDAIIKKDSRLLGFHYAQQEKKLATFIHPVQGWYVTSTRNWRGVETVNDPLPLGVYGDGAIAGCVMCAGKVAPGTPGSRLDNYRSSQVVHALIVVDANKITGMTIGSISDYLAVLTLSQARASEGCSQLPSIMDLMAPGCAADKKPDQITAGDLAFLRALYRANLETPVDLEESNIENAMMRDFSEKH
jgi:hypothetical protein